MTYIRPVLVLGSLVPFLSDSASSSSPLSCFLPLSGSRMMLSGFDQPLLLLQLFASCISNLRFSLDPCLAVLLGFWPNLTLEDEPLCPVDLGPRSATSSRACFFSFFFSFSFRLLQALGSAVLSGRCLLVTLLLSQSPGRLNYSRPLVWVALG